MTLKTFLSVGLLARRRSGRLPPLSRRAAGAPGPPGRRPPLIVIGIDGGEWKVIHRLWAEGKLPHLKRISEQGVATTLHTAYNSSPVIWTTIATGVAPEVHGITDFVVPTPRGDVPVSSAVRKVPALWNMLSRAGRRVAVLGWWASWPAEKVDGVVLSDRALLDLDGARLARLLPAAIPAGPPPGGRRSRPVRRRRGPAAGPGDGPFRGAPGARGV